MSNGQTYTTENEGQQSGWAMFAGYLMIVAGCFHIVSGLVALLKPDVYVTTANNLVLLDYTQWGWVHLIWGAILAASAMSLFAAKLWGRSVAIFMATVSAIVNFGFIWAYPVWSIMIIVMDIMIIYSVAVYGGGRERE